MSFASQLSDRIDSERREKLLRFWLKFSSNKLTLVGSLMVLSVIFCAIFAPYIAPYPEHTGPYFSIADRFIAPSLEHPLGTDGNGRDVLSRIIFGSRIAVLISLIVLSVSISVGVTLGLIAGYLGGWINIVIMRLVDVFLALPALILAMAVAAMLGPNIWITMLAISIHWWTAYTRLIQGEVLSISKQDYVQASETLGAPWYRTILREILPNVAAPIIVKATLDVGFVILIASGLAFLGLGTQPPNPDWGVMVSRGQQNVLTAWWVSTFPGLAIGYTVLGFNLLGDGLRDAFDVDLDLNE